VLPDADVLGFPFGIRYEDILGHRGLLHSLTFALVLSWIVAFLAFPRLPKRWTRFLLFSYFFIVTASHGALDAMTDGGLGIAFFAPFDNTRYFSIPPYQGLAYRALILQRPRTRCNLERTPLAVRSCCHHRGRGSFLP
jgi:membrane-bound metal-dependent hydrolase YbcI (DUF457 family)